MLEESIIYFLNFKRCKMLTASSGLFSEDGRQYKRTLRGLREAYANLLIVSC